MKKWIEWVKQLNEEGAVSDNRLIKAETYLFLFLTASVIGWIYELFFYWIMENRIDNHGFFFGPYLPIYGFGALLFVLFTKRFKKYPVAVFFLTIPISGILEYVVGYAMYEIWATRWWDYRTKFMNIGGFVCLRSVFTFAIGALMLMYFVEPLICYLSHKMKARTRNIVCICILSVFLIDIIATVMFRMPAFA